jgi:hypothetical protein
MRRRDERLADAALEDHLFVELADARRAFARAEQEDAVEPAVGIVPPLAIATRFAPSRAVIVPATRSHVTRGRSSANSSDG